jgi:hypothetical protein
MQEPYSERSRYPHRPNGDGTIDSICPRCFLTIGCSTWEADLEYMELRHVCDPDRLRYFHPKEQCPPKTQLGKVIPMHRRDEVERSNKKQHLAS